MCKDDEHICIVNGVEVCVKDVLDPGKQCNCILTKAYQQEDFDADFIHNNCDNCKKIYNPDQTDEDGNSIGDICDNSPKSFNRDQTDREKEMLVIKTLTFQMYLLMLRNKGRRKTNKALLLQQ